MVLSIITNSSQIRYELSMILLDMNKNKYRNEIEFSESDINIQNVSISGREVFSSTEMSLGREKSPDGPWGEIRCFRQPRPGQKPVQR